MAVHEQLVNSWAYRVLERVVPHPEDFVCLSTGNSGDFSPQPLGRRTFSLFFQKIFMFVVRANFVGQKIS